MGCQPLSTVERIRGFFAAGQCQLQALATKYDSAAIRATVQPEGSVALLRKGKVVRMTLGEFADHMKPAKDRIEERIYDPLVRVDGDIAFVWAPYDFLVNGQVKHCGTDAVNLVRIDGRWLIAGIADNSRDTCPAR